MKIKKNSHREKSLTLFLTFFTFLIVFFTSCNKTNEVLNPDNNEPNNTRDEATVLTMGQKIDGYMTTSDTDWFTFVPGNVNQYDVTLIEITNHSESLEVNVEILDKDGNHIDDYHSDGGANLSINFSNPGGTYYLKLTSYYGQTEGSYSLKVSDTHANDEFEPNDTRDDAYDLGTLPAIEKQGVLVSTYEQDWYKFTTENNGVWDVVHFYFKNNTEDFELEMTIFDSEGSQIEDIFGQGGQNLEFNLFTKGGTFYIHVNSYYGQTQGSYTFTIENMHANDDNEPDDNFDQARIIDTYPTGDITGIILVDAANDNGGDYEFFKVDLPLGKKILWTVSPAAANTELHFGVYNLNQEYLGGLDGDDGQTLQFYVNNTGTTETGFYIRLGGFIGDNGNYTISFTEEDADTQRSGPGLSIQ